METSSASPAADASPAAEIDDALVRSTLRDQARLMGRIKLPKRGITKSPIKSRGKKPGPFARKARRNLTLARNLRWQRRRWLDGIFTQAELDETRQMLVFFKQMEEEANAPPKPTPTVIAQAVHDSIERNR